MPEKAEDTRKLLKLFGVAVTDFEEGSGELVDRIGELGDADGEVVAAVRELLEMIMNMNEKWQAATDRMFETQRQVLARVVRALPE